MRWFNLILFSIFLSSFSYADEKRDFQHFEVIAKFTGHTSYVNGLAFDKDNQHFYSAGDNTIRKWNIQTEKQVTLIEVFKSNGVYEVIRSVAFSPNVEKALVEARGLKDVFLVDLEKEIVQVLPQIKGFRSFAFIDESKIIAGDGWNSGIIKIIDLKHPDLEISFELNFKPTAINISPDKKLVAVGGDRFPEPYNNLAVIDLQTFEKSYFNGHDRNTTHVKFLNSQKLVSTYDRGIKVWDINTKQQIGETILTKDRIHDLQVINHGQKLIAAEFLGMSLWEIEGNKKLWDTQGENIFLAPLSLAVDPTENYIIFAGDYNDPEIHLWRIKK